MSEMENLRRQSEASAGQVANSLTDPVAARSLEESERVIRELQAQNEDLRRAQAELSASQARYFDLYDLAPVGYLTVSEQGLILEANLSVAALLDVPRQSMIKQPFSLYIFKEDQDSYYRHRKLISETGSPQSWELQMVRSDGTVFWAHLDTATAQDSEGAILFHIVITRIAERKQAEQALQEVIAKNRQLQKAESLGRMAGSIAHHFNNKLQTVMSNLELLGGLPQGMNPAKCLNMAKLATERAAEVSRLMLLFLGQTTSIREPRYLAELCWESLPMLQDTLPDGVILEADLPKPGAVVSVNTNEINRVLINLVCNAWEAMGGATGCIRLSVKPAQAKDIPLAHRYPVGWHPHGPDYVCLAVEDTGCGLAEAEIEKVFDPFYTTKFIGRGLGLPVVMGIVHSHGGVVTIESEPGQYSVFRVFFPVCNEAMPRLPEMGVQASAFEGGGTILLVDDDELLLTATGAMIEMLGFSLLTAKDGVEALEIFEQHRADIRCVITDLAMPRKDGWATLAALRELDTDLPVILASGYDEARVLSGDHPDHPQAFLGKPFGLQQLRDALAQALAANQTGAIQG